MRQQCEAGTDYLILSRTITDLHFGQITVISITIDAFCASASYPHLQRPFTFSKLTDFSPWTKSNKSWLSFSLRKDISSWKIYTKTVIILKDIFSGNNAELYTPPPTSPGALAHYILNKN